MKYPILRHETTSFKIGATWLETVVIQTTVRMTKPRVILKGKIKRLLREREDMGQLGDTTLDACVTAVEAFVQDLGTRMLRQAKASGAPTITPIELKRTVQASSDLAFLHAKVDAIDERDAKYYQKSTKPRKRKATTSNSSTMTSSSVASDTSPSTTTTPAKKRATSTAKTTASSPSSTATNTSDSGQPTTVSPPQPSSGMLSAIDEDDNYDSSDSDD